MSDKIREERQKEIEEFCKNLGITLYPYQMRILLNSCDRKIRLMAPRMIGKSVVRNITEVKKDEQAD